MGVGTQYQKSCVFYRAFFGMSAAVWGRMAVHMRFEQHEIAIYSDDLSVVDWG